MSEQFELRLPDLGLAGIPLAVSLWLVEVGAPILEGDRLVEIVAGSVTVDLPAPVSGRLLAIVAPEDEPVTTGQLLAVIEGLH